MKIPKIGFLMCLLFGIGGAAAAQTEIASRFNVDDESWWSATGSLLTYFGAGGNPGGFIELDDTAGRMDAHAPGKFLGDLTSYLGATLSFDVRNISGTLPDFEPFGRVDITNDGEDETAVAVLGGLGQPPPDGQWHTYSLPLSPNVWDGDLELVLQNVNDIKVDLRPTLDGSAVMGFDNFRIGFRSAAVPEPGSVALILGFGVTGVGILLRRRR